MILILLLVIINIMSIEGYTRKTKINVVKKNCEPAQPPRIKVLPSYSGGRFGDNLIAISHAYYFALKNNFQLVYEPFAYSDQLVLDTIFKKADIPAFKHRITYASKEIICTEKIQNNTLIKVPYFPESPFDEKKDQIHFTVDWTDQWFLTNLRALISLKKSLNLLSPPPHKISIALHVRKGGSYYEESQVSSDPKLLINCGGVYGLIYKMPLDEFYIDQINKITQLFPHVPLYIFLFTDDQNPQALAQRYQKSLNNNLIEFDYRKEQNDHCFHVLEDFFSMMNFDILIRPESNYSIMVEKLGFHSIVISPGKFLPLTLIQEGLITIKDQKIFKKYQEVCYGI